MKKRDFLLLKVPETFDPPAAPEFGSYRANLGVKMFGLKRSVHPNTALANKGRLKATQRGGVFR